MKDRICIVDHDMTSRDYLRECLEREGHEVVILNSGYQVKALLSEERFNIFILNRVENITGREIILNSLGENIHINIFPSPLNGFQNDFNLRSHGGISGIVRLIRDGKGHGRSKPIPEPHVVHGRVRASLHVRKDGWELVQSGYHNRELLWIWKKQIRTGMKG
ncbi:MAG: response regulator [Thermodesulfobacteriota bacterium]